MKLSIIIPTFNNQKMLGKCLEKVDESLKALKYESEIIVEKNSPKKNLGFAGACNQGAEKAKGEYLLFLNDDCFLEKDTIVKMLDFLEKNKQLVATQPIISKFKTNIKEVGYVVDLKKGKARLITEKHSWESSKVNIFKQGWVYGLSGTCLMIRRKIFQEMQGFDTNFHSYLEDVDLFIRLAKKNYHYSPTLKASCFHEHMSTSSKMGNYKQKQDFKNWIRIIIKNYPLSFIIKNFFPLFIERLRNLNGIIKSIWLLRIF